MENTQADRAYIFPVCKNFQLSHGLDRQIAVVGQRDSPGGDYRSGELGTHSLVERHSEGIFAKIYVCYCLDQLTCAVTELSVHY
jgi:hypothetical protein